MSFLIFLQFFKLINIFQMDKTTVIIETEYKEGMFGYEFSQNIGWLVGKTTDWVEGENTGVLTKQEYDEFINELVAADKNGTYLYSKPYYIYKGIKTC